MESRVIFARINGALRRVHGPGFRFLPTDEELIAHYLKRKVMSRPLPANIVPEANVYKSDPWELPGDPEVERYFFSTNEAKYSKGNRANRATNSGYWKASGKDRRIVVTDQGDEIVGLKKTLVFYTGKHTNRTKTTWIMHEYRLADGGSAVKPIIKIEPFEGSNVEAAAMMTNWVLCRVFQKKKKEEAMNGGKTSRRPLFFNLAPASSRSDSAQNGIMEEMAHSHEQETEEDSEESTNSCN